MTNGCDPKVIISWSSTHPFRTRRNGTDSRTHRGTKIVVFVCGVKSALLFLWARNKIPVDSLTPREVEIARRFSEGLTYKEIARQLHISPTTVRSHIQILYTKLGVANKAELATQLRTYP